MSAFTNEAVHLKAPFSRGAPREGVLRASRYHNGYMLQTSLHHRTSGGLGWFVLCCGLVDISSIYTYLDAGAASLQGLCRPCPPELEATRLL